MCHGALFLSASLLCVRPYCYLGRIKDPGHCLVQCRLLSLLAVHGVISAKEAAELYLPLAPAIILTARRTQAGRAQADLGERAGCPNGCARPYMAELGFVGDGPNSYQFWLGGSPNQTRLAEVFQDRVKIQVQHATSACLAPAPSVYHGTRPLSFMTFTG